MTSRQWRSFAHAARKRGIQIDQSELKLAKAREQTERTGPSARTHSQKETPSILRRFWQGVGAVAIFVTLLGGAYQFRPAMSVDLDQSIDPEQPFGTPLKFTNIGPLFALRHVRFTFAINNRNLKTDKGGEINFVPVTPVDVLEPGDSATKIVPVTFGDDRPNIAVRIRDKASPTEMKVFVHFKILWLPIEFTKQFRFITVNRADGNMQWIKEPISN